jgi:hypothetical protein
MLQSDRFDQVHWHRGEDWYASSRTTSNEAIQISPNPYEARNPRLTIAGDRPIRPFAKFIPLDAMAFSDGDDRET